MCLLLEFDRSKNKVNGKIMIDFSSVIKCLETMIQVPFAQMELSYFTCFQFFYYTMMESFLFLITGRAFGILCERLRKMETYKIKIGLHNQE